MDMEKALVEFDNDTSFLLEVLDEFFSTLTAQFPVMDRAVSENDFAILKENAHAIKGGAANLRANDLSSAAQALEELCKRENRQGLSPAMDKLLFEFARLREFCQEL